MVGVDNDEVNGDFKPTQLLPQTNKLLATTLHFRLNDKQVKIAIWPSITPSVRAEQDHLGITACCGRQTPASLLDHRLIDHGADKVTRKTEVRTDRLRLAS